MKKNNCHNLLIIGSTLGSYGGMEAYMMALAEAASKWPEFKVCLCFKLVKGKYQEENLISAAKKVCDDVHFVKSSSMHLLKLIAWSDIVHVQNTPPDIIFIGRLLSKKVLLTVHNWKRPISNLHTFLWSISVKFAHKRWFNSFFVWNTWEPGEKSKKSASFFTVPRLPVSWYPPDKRKGFIFIGRWVENKGIEEILKAYAKNGFSSQEWPLTLLGDGPIKPVIEKLIHELRLKEVHTPGFVDETSKEKYLASARWLLAPAKTREDLGATPIEARSVGVPSIVTRDGGLPEAGGPSALIAEPGDVNDLANCMKLAANMSETEYALRAQTAKESLEAMLKPMEFYRAAYLY